MTEEQEKAVALHHRGANCAQSVLLVFCEKYGLDSESGMRVAGGLGGGLRCGEVCGAVSGGVIVVGLKHAATKPENLDQKKFCGEKTEQFVEAFRQVYGKGKIRCRDLLEEKGHDICDELIAGSVALLCERDTSPTDNIQKKENKRI